MNINWKLAAAGLLSAAGGAAIGYVVAYKRLEQVFANRLDDEIAFAKDFYTKLHKIGDFETPEKAVEVLIPEQSETAARARTAIETYKPDPEGLERLKKSYHPQVAPPKSVWDSGPPPVDLGEETPAHDANKPYRISDADFVSSDDYPQFTYTYYAGDDVVADENDQKIENAEDVVGTRNLKHWNGPDPMYIRNEPRMIEIEVVYSEGRYDVEVLGHTFDGG